MPQPKVRAVVALLALLAGLGVVTASPASAATTLQWTGAGSDNKWSTPANWNPAQVPQNLDSVVFPAGALGLSSTNDAVSGLTSLSLTGSGYTIGGNRTTTSVVTQSGSSKLVNTISLPLVVAERVQNHATADSILALGPVELFGNDIAIENNGVIDFTGPVTGGGGIHQDPGHDASSTVFRGNNTYTGPTNWHSGELVVNGTQTSTATTIDGGVLDGSGTLGAVTIQGSGDNPGVLNPGAPIGTIGTMHVGDTRIVESGTLDVDAAGPGAGQFDQLVVTGSVLIGGDLVVNFVTKPAVGTTFKIIDNDGTDSVQGGFLGIPEGASFESDGSFFRITYRGGDGNDVVLTTINPPAPSILTAPGSGGGPNIRSFGGRSLNFMAGGGTGGAYVAARDFDYDGLDEIVAGSGAGVPSNVTLYRVDGAVLRTFSPYGAFAGGVSVAVGDLDGDGAQEIVTGAGPGGGPDVSVFRADGLLLNRFFVYDPNFHGGVNVATGDLNGDGADEIIVGAGSGGGPHVRIFNGDGTPQGLGFFAYDARFNGGVSVATGDLDGDGTSEVITGAGAGGGPHVRTFAGDGTPLGGGFFAYADGFLGGVKVGSYPNFNLGHDDIVTGVGPGGGPNVKGFHPDGSPVFSFFAYDAGFTGGVRVAGALLNTAQ